MNGGKKILIVEDDELIIKILEFILNKEGYELSVIRDGLSAIENLKMINPDLVMTDLMLPYKSGLEIISYVKENLEKTRIIVLSALGQEEHSVSEAFKLGADDFIAKPFKPAEIEAIIKKWAPKIIEHKSKDQSISLS